ncbi:MAG: EutN/CcmL family microcompartment protein [Anaerolineaceae bacterium]|nr:EutN/CcmL family microcompartment protein [Anaerolineaceae bacterium]
MEIGKVIGTVTTTIKHPAYEGKRILVVQEMDLGGKLTDIIRVAVDYIGAGYGDLVLFGGAPGVAAEVFDISKAPIRDLIIGIIDRFDIDNQKIFSLYDDV